MTARPMTEGEREEALEEARGLVRHAGQITGLLIDETHVRLARALLSTSSAERGMREKCVEIALAESMKAPQSQDHPWDRGYRAGAAAVWSKLAALSGIEGEDEQACGQGRSESTDTKE